VEQFSNEGGGILAADATDSATSLTIKNPQDVPDSGTFRARVDSEYLRVTAVSGDKLTWTVARGDGGTAAAAHAADTPVYIVVTKEAIDAIVTVQGDGTEVASRRVLNFTGATVTDDPANGRVHVDFVPGGATLGAIADLPAAGEAGRVYAPTDAPNLRVDDGSVWTPYGPIYRLTTPPAAASWTWTNQGGATLSDSPVGPFMYAPHASGDLVRYVTIAYPATPFVLTCCFTCVQPRANFPQFGFVLDAGGPQFTFVGPKLLSGLPAWTVAHWNNTTSWHDALVEEPCLVYGAPFWQRMTDDGTHRTYYVSADGSNFVQWAQETSTNWIAAPTRLGWGIDLTNNLDWGLTLLSWRVG
jgi:hypothetical protein